MRISSSLPSKLTLGTTSCKTWLKQPWIIQDWSCHMLNSMCKCFYCSCLQNMNKNGLALTYNESLRYGPPKRKSWVRILCTILLGWCNLVTGNKQLLKQRKLRRQEEHVKNISRFILWVNSSPDGYLSKRIYIRIGNFNSLILNHACQFSNQRN